LTIGHRAAGLSGVNSRLKTEYGPSLAARPGTAARPGAPPLQARPFG